MLCTMVRATFPASLQRMTCVLRVPGVGHSSTRLLGVKVLAPPTPVPSTGMQHLTFHVESNAIHTRTRSLLCTMVRATFPASLQRMTCVLRAPGVGHSSTRLLGVKVLAPPTPVPLTGMQHLTFHVESNAIHTRTRSMLFTMARATFPASLQRMTCVLRALGVGHSSTRL